MKKPVHHFVPVTLEGLTKNLSFEVKRLVREKEDGVVSHVRTKVALNGISTLVFKNKEGKKVTLLYRHDEGGTLRFAREAQFLNRK
ncbi:MAG TPA: hypothetical protein VMR99_01775 [Candidatus Paceibacterota bacterium]|nr:hypothetical protein [Candidatus Paceibacterota bacterium]